MFSGDSLSDFTTFFLLADVFGVTDFLDVEAFGVTIVFLLAEALGVFDGADFSDFFNVSGEIFMDLRSGSLVLRIKVHSSLRSDRCH